MRTLEQVARDEARKLVNHPVTEVVSVEECIMRLKKAFPGYQEEKVVEVLKDQWVSVFENLGAPSMDEVLEGRYV